MSPSTESWGCCTAMMCLHTWERGATAAMCCFPAVCQVVVVLHLCNSWTTGSAYFPFPWPVPQPPLSFPWCPVVQPGLEGPIDVSHRLKQSWSMLEKALPAHPTIYLSHGGICCVRYQNGFADPSLAREIHPCYWNELSLYLQTDWLMFCPNWPAQLKLAAYVWSGGKLSRNNYKVSHLNDQVFPE